MTIISRRRFLQAVGTAAGVGAGAGLYAWRFEPHWFETVERRLALPHLPESLVGGRLVQLSDLHVGPWVDEAYLLRVFRHVEGLSPEIVVYTGDLTSYDAEVFARAERMFAHLPRGRLATAGILGNHDYGPRWSRGEVADGIAERASTAGVRILRNQAFQVEGMWIIGLDDLWAGRFDPERVLLNLPPQAPSLVLSHNPDTVDRPGWGTYRGWVLCGHTHGGQCKLPLLAPPWLPVRNRRYAAGEYALADGRRLYVSRGVGHTLRVRFGVRPEVTVFHLEGA